MNDPAIARPPERRRLAMIVAGALALLGSFVVTAPAQAGYYDGGYYGGYYGSHPCSYRCGYRSYAPRYYNGCGRCGCYRRCGSGAVFERRYIEREFIERRYGYGGGYRHCYGDYPCGGYRPHYGYYPSYGGYRRPWGYGYGGVGRRWPTPSLSYEPIGDGYEEPPRPPAPVYGYETEY